MNTMKMIFLSFIVWTAWSLAAGSESTDARCSKYLVLDATVVQSTDNLKRMMHRPRRHPNNPIIVGSRPWEKWTAYVNGRAVLYDPESAEFKMWYLASLMDPKAHGGIQYKACFARSGDGIHWERPVLNQVAWPGAPDNNIIKWGENWMRRPNVILDPNDAHPQRRFKMTYVDVFDGKSAITKAHSPDGIHWKLNADGSPWFRRGHNANLLGWDPRIQNYVMYVRMSGMAQNTVGRSVSPDFVRWSEPDTVLRPRSDEPRKHFKGLAAFLYEGIYMGWLWVFQRGEREWLRADAELAISHDGVRWERPFAGTYFLSRGEPDAWDSHLAIPVAPVVHADKIWIYYWGENLPYGGKGSLQRLQEGWIKEGTRIQRAIGLATLRLDGFVSLRAGAGETGTLLTRPLLLRGDRLLVNAEVRGEMRVALRRPNGNEIAGYGLDECIPIRGDSLRHRVTWNESRDLGKYAGEQVQVHFCLKDADLYSFCWEE